MQLRRLIAAGETSFVLRLVESMQTQIIGAALEQGRSKARAKHLAHARQVAMEQLILQRLGAGGNDHALARHQCGNKIGERLAGAGAGFDDEHLSIGNCFLDRRSH